MGWKCSLKKLDCLLNKILQFKNLHYFPDCLLIFVCLFNCNYAALVPVSEFSDPIIMKKYGVKPDHETLDIVNTAARWEQIVAVMKIHWGDPREKICEAIDNIPLSCLIIGNRGLGKLKR
ncbi:universal stress protein PHOS32 [Fagus crenata]